MRSPTDGRNVRLCGVLWQTAWRYLWDIRIISIERVAEIVAGSQSYIDETGSGCFAIAFTGRPERLIGFCCHHRFDDAKSGFRA